MLLGLSMRTRSCKTTLDGRGGRVGVQFPLPWDSTLFLEKRLAAWGLANFTVDDVVVFMIWYGELPAS
jgi:hypothetical protein